LNLVTDTAALRTAAEVMARAPRIGVDTEFLREKTYHPRLCLVQVATPDDIWLIDPLDGVDLGPLADVLAAPSVQVIVHAGKQDLEIFHEQLKVVPANVYDVQLAAGFAGYGSSLAYGRLVELALRQTLVKGEAYTDWCRRPLTEAQLTYAADDVRYLIPIAEKLDAELDKLGRTRWAAEEMESLSDPATYRLEMDEAWRKVAGRGSLSGRQIAILREVARWREETAVRRDLPRGWIVKDPTLVEIARRSPSSLEALKKIRGINSREAERSARDILQALDRGRKSPPVATGGAPPRAAQIQARMISGLGDAIVRSRCEDAGIATELVATRTELEALLADVLSGEVDGSHHRLLRGWRRELAGDAVVALARGRIGLRVTARPPYVQEILLDEATAANAGDIAEAAKRS
jgi:ribonuclease D